MAADILDVVERVLLRTAFGALPAGTGLLTSVCGTHDFLAPEMILCGWGEVAGYGTAVDMWAIGLLLFCILYETNPFEHASEIETLSGESAGRPDENDEGFPHETGFAEPLLENFGPGNKSP